MPTAALLAPRPTAPTRACLDTSCNWARSSIDECECTQCNYGHGHGGAYRATQLCPCGDIVGECFC